MADFAGAQGIGANRPRATPTPSTWRNSLQTFAAVFALGGLAVFLYIQEPHWHLLVEAPLVIKAHLAAATGAFALGGVLLGWRKGKTFHRVMGWVWVVFVGAATLTSTFIMVENPGSWSWIHSSTVISAILLPLAVFFAKRHNVKWHRRTMLFLYWSALFGAGAMAFMPDRLLGRVFFG